MHGNLGRDYDQDDDLDYADDDWRQERLHTPGRMVYHHHSYPVQQQHQRPPVSSVVRITAPSGTVRKFPLIIRKVGPPPHSRGVPSQQQHHQPQYHHQQLQHHQQQHQQQSLPLFRQLGGAQHQLRVVKMEPGQRPGHSRAMQQPVGGHEVPYLVPYANEETVRTTEHHDGDEGEEEEEEGEEEDEEGGRHSGGLQEDHSIKRLEEDLEVDVEGGVAAAAAAADGGGGGPSSSGGMPKMVVRPKTLPVFHPADHKAVIENHQLRARLGTLIDSNCRFRDEVAGLREDKRELIKQMRKLEKIIEKQGVDLAHAESAMAESRRAEKEQERRHERELSVREKRRKAMTIMPSLPNRKVVFSKATKQAQSLRLRLLHRYLGELCGPVASERRLEEKNLIVLRWRKAHAPKPSLEIGRQLLPEEEEDFCKRFAIQGERKKEMKRWLGHKHIDLFGPSERALAVRKWRMGQREKRRRGEKEEPVGEVEQAVLDEAGEDSDDDVLMEDIERAMDDELDGEDGGGVVVERGGGGRKTRGGRGGGGARGRGDDDDEEIVGHIVEEEEDEEEEEEGIPVLTNETA